MLILVVVLPDQLAVQFKGGGFSSDSWSVDDFLGSQEF